MAEISEDQSDDFVNLSLNDAADDDFEYLTLPEIDAADLDDQDFNDENLRHGAAFRSQIPFENIHKDPLPFDSYKRRCFIPGKKVRVKIDQVDKSSHKLMNPYLYYIQLQHGDNIWTVKRRYKHFRQLHEALMLYKAKITFSALNKEKRERRKSMAVRKQYLPKFPMMPEPLVREDGLEERKTQLEDYLQNVLHCSHFRNNDETLKFLEVSHVSFMHGIGAKNKEGLIQKRAGGRRVPIGCCGCCCAGVNSCILCANWKKRWFVVKDTFVAYFDPDKGTLNDVLLMDREFDVELGLSTTGFRQGLKIQNQSRHLVLKSWTGRKAQEWKEAIKGTMESTGKDFVTTNRYESFAPYRDNMYCRWFVDGSSYMSACADAMEAARSEIYIADWWLSPEVYMKRPMTEGEKWRLDQLLQRKANQGVRIFVLLFKEMQMALGINSFYTKNALLKLHPTNVKVLRHPDGMSLWSHHEKCVVVDQRIAFLGGIDLCYGRWDTPSHKLDDLGSVIQTSPEPILPAAKTGGKLFSLEASKIKSENNNLSVQVHANVEDRGVDQLDRPPTYQRSVSHVSAKSWPEDLRHFEKRNKTKSAIELGNKDANIQYSDQALNLSSKSTDTANISVQFSETPDKQTTFSITENVENDLSKVSESQFISVAKNIPETKVEKAEIIDEEKLLPNQISQEENQLNESFDSNTSTGSVNHAFAKGPNDVVEMNERKMVQNEQFELVQGNVNQNANPDGEEKENGVQKGDGVENENGADKQDGGNRNEANQKAEASEETERKSKVKDKRPATLQIDSVSNRTSRNRGKLTRTSTFDVPESAKSPRSPFFAENPLDNSEAKPNTPAGRRKITWREAAARMRASTPNPSTKKPTTPEPRRKFIGLVQRAQELKEDLRDIKRKFRQNRSQSMDVPTIAASTPTREESYRCHDQLPDDALTGQGKIWIGKDYANFIYKDFVDLDKPFTDFVDRQQTPRMPWHDIGAVVYGRCARDVARHFIQRWNFTKIEKRKTNPSYPMLIPMSYDRIPVSQSVQADAFCARCQILRSSCKWSTGMDYTENSVQKAYIDLIKKAKHYIYIENQFFISVIDHPEVENQVAKELMERIIRAEKNRENFRVYVIMPLLPAFEGEIGTSSGISIQAITHWNYVSICRGGKSLLDRLSNYVRDPHEYISFYGLRTHGEIMGNLTSELVYVHSKLMIVDDTHVIIGSANINDRSLTGNRDSELAVLIQDTRTFATTMDSKAFRSGQFAGSLRMSLFKEHLGVKDGDGVDVTDPVCKDFYKGVWVAQAAINTSTFSRVFNCIPSDEFKTFQQVKNNAKKKQLAQTDPEQSRELLKKVKGHLVMLPLQFLSDENLTPPVGTKEYMAPTAVFT